MNRISLKLTNSFVMNDVNTGFLSALKTLIYRSFLNTMRNPNLFRAKIFKSIFIALFIGGVFFGLGDKDYNDRSNWHSITGFVFFLTFYCLVLTLLSITLTFPL